MSQPKDPKDKKGPAAAPNKKPVTAAGAKADPNPAEESEANLKPVFMENNKIIYSADMRDFSEVPEFQPIVLSA